MNLDTFIQQKSPPNAWIEERDIEIYVRKSKRLIGDKIFLCLDIGSVEVAEKRRGQGLFRAFLHRFEEEAKKQNRVVFVESILNNRLYKFLLANGYTHDPRSHPICPNVFKIPAWLFIVGRYNVASWIKNTRMDSAQLRNK